MLGCGGRSVKILRHHSDCLRGDAFEWKQVFQELVCAFSGTNRLNKETAKHILGQVLGAMGAKITFKLKSHKFSTSNFFT